MEKPTTRTRLQSVWRFGKKYTPLFAVAEICTLVSSAVSLLLPLNLSRLTDKVLYGRQYDLLTPVIRDYLLLFGIATPPRTTGISIRRFLLVVRRSFPWMDYHAFGLPERATMFGNFLLSKKWDFKLVSQRIVFEKLFNSCWYRDSGRRHFYQRYSIYRLIKTTNSD